MLALNADDDDDSGTALAREEATMTNKLLLAAIAFGLWANAAIWFVRPVQAQSDQLAGGVQQIAEEIGRAHV